VFACVRILSESLAMLPAILYRSLEGGGKERLRGHSIYALIHDAPNDELTPFAFKETLMAHCLTWGNCYAEIEFSGRGLPVALWPLAPQRVNVDRGADGGLIYDVQNTGGPNTVLKPADVLHVPALGFDGIHGYSPVRMAMQAVGLGLAAETFGSRFFGNGANATGVLTHPAQLSKTALDNLKQSFREKHQGLDNSHEPLILEEGMKYDRWTIPPEEAQFLETRKFQVQEVARIYRVPPHMLADLDRATFSNIEHQSLEFVSYSLMPWLVRWQEALTRRLLTPEDRAAGMFIEFVPQALLRGDAAGRATYYRQMREMGVLTADDICEFENLNPLPDGLGKTYILPANMQDAAKLTEPAPAPAPTPAPEPPPASDDEDEDEDEEEDEGDDMQRMRAAVRLLAVDAARRVVRKEVNALTRAADKPDYRAKLAAFYADHTAHVIEVLCPVAQALERAGMACRNLPDVAAAYARRAAAQLAGDNPAALLAAWERDAAAQLIDELTGAHHE
jgi:HK97 family phage portal protein